MKIKMEAEQNITRYINENMETYNAKFSIEEWTQAIGTNKSKAIESEEIYHEKIRQIPEEVLQYIY